MGLLSFGMHLLVNALGGYGYFRDELYYLACSRHLAAGYVDQPPFSIFLLALARTFLGDSVFAIRLIPAIVSGLSVAILCLLVRRLSGGRTAMVIASLAFICSAQILGFHAYYSMNSLDILFWILAAYILVLLNERAIAEKMGAPGPGPGARVAEQDERALARRGHRRRPSPDEPQESPQDPRSVSGGRDGIAPLFALHLLERRPRLPSPRVHEERVGRQVLGADAIAIPRRPVREHEPAGRSCRVAGLVLVTLLKRRPALQVSRRLSFSRCSGSCFSTRTRKAEYIAAAYTLLFAGGGVMVERLGRRWGRGVPLALGAVLVASGLLVAPFAVAGVASRDVHSLRRHDGGVAEHSRETATRRAAPVLRRHAGLGGAGAGRVEGVPLDSRAGAVHHRRARQQLW